MASYRGLACQALLLSMFALPALAQENPYIVTYDHYLEEPGSLEVEYFSIFGTQRGGNDFHAFLGRVRIWRHRLVDDRALRRRPDHLQRQHHFYWFSLGEPLSPAQGRAFHH